MTEKENTSKMVGYDGAEVFLGFPKGTIYSMVCKKQIPHYRVGPRHVLFCIDELKGWLKQHRVSAEGTK